MRPSVDRLRVTRAHALSAALHAALVALAVAAAHDAHDVPGAPAHAPAPRTPDAPAEFDLVAREPPRAQPPPPRRDEPPAPRARPAAAARATLPAPGAAVTVAPDTRRWQTPANVAPTSEAPALPRAAGLLRAAGADVLRAGAVDLAREARGDDLTARLRDDLGRYLADHANAARHDNVAGSSGYYQPLQREMQRAWRTTAARTVSVAEGIAGSVVAGPEAFRRVQEAMEGTLAPTRRSAAATALDQAHPNAPMLSNPPHASARAEATARTTRAVLEVDQDAQARIVAMRVVESSGVARFDASAREAVEAAVEAVPPRPMPGGWRSRWLFEVTRSRVPPPLGFLPSLPDEGPRFGPAVGGTFDESTLTASADIPLALRERRAVRLLWSESLGPARDGGA